MARRGADRIPAAVPVALLWLTFLVVAAFAAPSLPLPPVDALDPGCLAALPGEHLLGTDQLGRDILSRLLFGARVSLTVGFLAPLVGLVAGTLLGLAAGFYGGWTDRVAAVLIDCFLSFPRLVFLLMFTFVFGSGLSTLTIGIGILTIPSFARVARANTLRLIRRDFVVAARAVGEGDFSIMLREILPNVLAPLVGYMLLVAGYVIIAEGGLGFLGLSVPSPTPTWGGMIAAGRDVLEEAPHVSLIPTCAMFLTVLSCNVVGDTVRRRFETGEGGR